MANGTIKGHEYITQSVTFGSKTVSPVNYADIEVTNSVSGYTLAGAVGWTLNSVTQVGVVYVSAISGSTIRIRVFNPNTSASQTISGGTIILLYKHD